MLAVPDRIFGNGLRRGEVGVWTDSKGRWDISSRQYIHLTVGGKRVRRLEVKGRENHLEIQGPLGRKAYVEFREEGQMEER